MRIKIKTLNYILEKATAKELDFLIYCGRFQDENGIIKGIKQTHIQKELGIKKSTFYKILYSLEAKEIIKINWTKVHYSYWTFQILNNTFMKKTDYAEGYINLNTAVFFDKRWKNYCLAEKKIILNLLKVYRPARRSIPITIDTLKIWTGNQTQSILKNTKRLGDLFKISRKGNTIYFNEFLIAFRKYDSETNLQSKHFIKFIESVYKIDPGSIDRKSIIGLFSQFKQQDQYSCKNQYYDIILSILYSIKNKASLIPQYINAMIHKIRNKGIKRDFQLEILAETFI